MTAKTMVNASASRSGLGSSADEPREVGGRPVALRPRVSAWERELFESGMMGEILSGELGSGGMMGEEETTTVRGLSGGLGIEGGCDTALGVEGVGEVGAGGNGGWRGGAGVNEFWGDGGEGRGGEGFSAGGFGRDVAGGDCLGGGGGLDAVGRAGNSARVGMVPEARKAVATS